MASEWNVETLKQHYDERFKTIDQRFTDAEKYNATVQSASQEAIKKAEAAQQQYNTIHNDLVRKNEKMQTREDSDKDIKNMVDKIESLRLHFEDKINLLTTRSDASQGRYTGMKDLRDLVPWLIAIAMFLFYLYNQGEK